MLQSPDLINFAVPAMCHDQWESAFRAMFAEKPPINSTQQPPRLQHEYGDFFLDFHNKWLYSYAHEAF